MTSRETGQINNTMLICDNCEERHRGTKRIVAHKVNGKEIYYSSKLCHKCEEKESK